MPTMYKFCNRCGRELPTGKTLNFCPYCGKKLPVVPVASPQPPVEATTSVEVTPQPAPTPTPAPVAPVVEPTTQVSLSEGAVSRRLTEGATPPPAAPVAPPETDAPAPARTSKPAREPKPRDRAPKVPKPTKTPPKAGDLIFAVLSALIILSAVCVSVYYLTPLAAMRKDAKILEQADAYLAENDLDSALAAISELSYPDEHPKQASAVYYAVATAAFSQKDYDTAVEYFDLCPDYADSALQSAELHYQLGILAMDSDMYDISVKGGRSGYNYFADADNTYSRSYVKARQLADYDGLEKAIAHFKKAGDYANASEFYVKCCNMLGERAYWKEDFDKAIECFTLSGAAQGVETCEQLKAAEQERCAQYGERMKYGYQHDTHYSNYEYFYREFAVLDDIYAVSLAEIHKSDPNIWQTDGQKIIAGNEVPYVDKAYARKEGDSLVITVFLNRNSDDLFYTARSYTDGGEMDYSSGDDYCSGSVPGTDDVFSFAIDAASILDGERQLTLDFYFSKKSNSPDFTLSFDRQQLLRIAKGN